MTNELEPWCAGILSKHTLDAVAVLADLLNAARARGECSADDVQARNYSRPQIVGAVFKLLPTFGLRKNRARWFASKHKTNHGREIYMYEVVDSRKVNAAVGVCRRLLLAEDQDGQGVLL